jgi:hypothetical protein
LLRWIEGEDPAVAFTTQPPPEARLRALPKTEHLPSYSTIQPILKELPPFKMNLGIPSSRPPGAVRWSFPRTAAVAVSAGTYISFSKEFDQFGAPMLPRLAFTRSTEETPETLQFRVAVNHLGEIRYCFPVNSSGDPALDEQARLKVIRSRFSQRPVKGGDQLLVWGTAVVHWGSDIARPQQTPSGTLTP